MVVRFQPSSATALSTDQVELFGVHPRIAVLAGLVHEGDLHHAVGAGVGKWVDEDGVDDAEDGAGGADAEGEGEDRGKGESRTPPQFAGGVAQIGRQ